MGPLGTDVRARRRRPAHLRTATETEPRVVRRHREGERHLRRANSRSLMTSHASRPWNLRVEHLREAFGIGTRTPRLSWKLPNMAAGQVAYRIRGGEWDSGKGESGESVFVPYAGPPLASRQQVDWQVKVWTDTGETE